MKNGILLCLYMICSTTYAQEFTDKWKSSLIQQSGDDELIDIAINTNGYVASISRSFDQNGDTGSENEIRIDMHTSAGSLQWSHTDVVGNGMPVSVLISGSDVVGVSNFDVGMSNSGVTLHGYKLDGTRKTGYPRSYKAIGGAVANDATIVGTNIHAVGYRNNGISIDMILIRSVLSNTTGTIYTTSYGDSGGDEYGRAICALSSHSVVLVEDGNDMRALKYGTNTSISTPDEARTFTVTGAVYGEVVGIKGLDENNVFAVFQEAGDYILKKYDMLSTFSGEFATRITDLDEVKDFMVDDSGNTYLTGIDNQKLFLAKYNSSGIRQFMVYGSSLTGTYGASVFVNDDGNITVAGRLSISGVISPGVAVFDTDGIELKTYNYGTSTDNSPVLKAIGGPKNFVAIAGAYNKNLNYDSRRLWAICDLPQASFSPENPTIPVGGSVSVSITKESGTSAQWDHNNSLGTVELSQPGLYTANVSYDGYTFYSCDNAISVIVRGAQNISFPSLSAKSVLADDFALGASSTSGLAIAYASSNTNVATVSDGVVSIVGAGSTIITASQSGTTYYEAAQSVSRTLTVNKESQTLDFAISSPVTLIQAHLDEPTNDQFILKSAIQSAEGNNGTSLVSSDPTVLAVSDGGTAWLLNYKKAGSVTLTASIAEDDIYLGTSDQQVFSLVKTDQQISVNTPITQRYFGEPSFDVNVANVGGQSNSGNPITVTSDDPSVVTVSGETVTVVGIGSTTIRANQNGNELFNNATEATIDINVGRATFTWGGSSWYNANRVTRIYPEVEDNVEIQQPYITTNDGAFNAYTLDINSSGSLRVSSGHSLQVKKDIVNSGELIIESGASLITYEGNSIPSNISIYRSTRYVDGKYSFVGSPVAQSSSVTGSDLGTNVYKYNESTPYGNNDGLDRWENASSDELIPGQGYTQANQQEITFQGQPNAGTITYWGSYTSDGWHLVSNPYAAAIFIDDFLDANTNTTDAIYIWDDNDSETGRGSNDDYIVANKTGATDINGTDNDARWNSYIGSAQAFFVQLDGSAGNITFTESMRRTGNNADANFFRKVANELPLLRMNLLSDDGLHKQAIVGWNEEVSNEELSEGYDAKVFNATADYLIYTIKANTALAIQTVNSQKEEIPIGIRVAEPGTYSIQFQPENLTNQSLYLLDKVTNVSTNISSGAYRFTTSTGEFTDRFVLTTSQTVLALEDEKTNFYAFKKALHILSNSMEPIQLQLFDLSGVRLMTITTSGSNMINLGHLKNGIYIISNGVDSKKIIIQ